MSVNRERVQLLVAALRSGEFVQTSGRLGHAGRYCCLGVACVVAQRSGFDRLRDHVAVDGDVTFGVDDADMEFSLLPRSVQNWYGFDDDDPHLDPGDVDTDLDTAAELNDGGNFNFDAIADAFERTYLRDETIAGVDGSVDPDVNRSEGERG